MRIGYFKHWSQPHYSFITFLKAEGIQIEQVDYSLPHYLEDFDIVLIEQNGFNDYIENDELYIQDWVKRGGICLFMHQDYSRWAPGFLPEELGYVQLIHRYVPTLTMNTPGGNYMCYMMPWIEPCGKGLFSQPNAITADEMIDWQIRVNSFTLVKPQDGHDTTESVRTSALSCYLPNEHWKVLGTYMDPSVRDGALLLQGTYGKGMYFLNQLLFPEEQTPDAERCFAFWKKYVPNLLDYFRRFKQGVTDPIPAQSQDLPLKKNYKMCIHMHSLDWYGCDSAPGTINALMRYLNIDICSLAVKNLSQFQGTISLENYSDDRVLFLNGQEYHPFNWKDKDDAVSHNNYHMLAMGIDPEGYTTQFTKSLFGDQEVDSYIKTGIRYIHDYHGAVCCAHPWTDYWRNYDYDAVDHEDLCSLAGSDIEEHWLAGNRIAVMSSVDLFGIRRIFDNHAVNFIYLQGERPSRDAIVKAVKAQHTIATGWFEEADVTLNGKLPGDEISRQEAAQGTVHVSATITEGLIRAVRVYSGAKVIASAHPDTKDIDLDFPLTGCEINQFIRVEAEGDDKVHVLISTPFYVV